MEIKISQKSLDAFKSGKDLSSHFGYAIQYVRDHKQWSDAEESVALDNINHYRCDVNVASPSIKNQIALLMDEYGEENELPKSWWTDFGYENDIFFKL